MPNPLKPLLVAAVIAVAAPLAPAADDPPAAPATDPLGKARELIAGLKWSDAIGELRRVNQTRSADWHNLMGYALRKQASPDLVGARRHYDEALRLDPRHRGALEYAGELDLMTGDLAAAERRLQRLEAVCGTGCDEYRDLQAAIARHRAGPARATPPS